MFLIPSIVFAVLAMIIFNTGLELYAQEGLSLDSGMHLLMACAFSLPFLYLMGSTLGVLFRGFRS